VGVSTGDGSQNVDLEILKGEEGVEIDNTNNQLVWRIRDLQEVESTVLSFKSATI
jgi:uncharacterized protein YccT (UPF0319 family)